MATADYWSEKDLKDVTYGNDGWVREDVMSEIWDISKIPLPFMDMIGSDTAKQSYTEWNEDKLADPDTANAKVDGQDISGSDASGGERIGNHCQISTKTVIVTERAQASDTIGGNQLAYQLTMRQRELMRDIEAINLTGQASQSDDGDTTPGKIGGLAACIDQGDLGGSTGGGFSTGSWSARTPGAKRALTEEMVRDVAQLVWEQGGDPSVLMSTPPTIRKLSEYMFSSSARIATLTAETNQNGPATAMGSVNVFLTDFGVELKLIPNRLQQPFEDSAASGTPDTANVFLLDPSYARHAVLKGTRVEPLAKTGLADKRMMAKDWTLKVLNRSAHGLIADIDFNTAVTAS